MIPTKNKSEWENRNHPTSGNSLLNLAEIWRYRDLVISFVKRDFVSFYKQTLLGPLWYLIQPVASSVILYVVFTKVARLPTSDIPPFLFYLSGNVLWIYFSENIIRTSETFLQNASIFGKVYFPRLTVPVSVSISGLIAFGLQFLLFLGFYIKSIAAGNLLFDPMRLLFLPLVILHLVLNSFSIGLLIAGLTNKYRDLRFTLKFGMQLWMFGSPIAYATTQVPREFLNAYMINPVTPAIEGFRYIFFGQSMLTSDHILLSAGITLFLLFASLIIFNRIERTFVDNV